MPLAAGPPQQQHREGAPPPRSPSSAAAAPAAASYRGEWRAAILDRLAASLGDGKGPGDGPRGSHGTTGFTVPEPLDLDRLGAALVAVVKLELKPSIKLVQVRRAT